MEQKSAIWRMPLIIIVIITLIALGAMTLIMVIPKTKTVVSGDLRVEYTPDRDDFEYNSHLFPVKITTPYGIDSAVMYYGGKDGFEQESLFPVVEDSEWYATTLELPQRGIRIYYYFVIRDLGGSEITLPAKATPEFTSEYNYFKIRAEGHVSRAALYFHILLMLIAIILFIHVLYDALYILNGGSRAQRIYRTTLYAQICFFITGFPLGWLIEKQVLGNYWEGIPFGWDITDSKTLFIFIYWMIPLILSWTKKIGERGFAKWALGGVLFTVAMFLLPHSI
jgi:hypothetical protein